MRKTKAGFWEKPARKPYCNCSDPSVGATELQKLPLGEPEPPHDAVALRLHLGNRELFGRPVAFHRCDDLTADEGEHLQLQPRPLLLGADSDAEAVIQPRQLLFWCPQRPFDQPRLHPSKLPLPLARVSLAERMPAIGRPAAFVRFHGTLLSPIRQLADIRDSILCTFVWLNLI